MTCSSLAHRVIEARGTLDELRLTDTTSLPNGALCWVYEHVAYYVLRRDAEPRASGDEVVVPASGPGCWLKTTEFRSSTALVLGPSVLAGNDPQVVDLPPPVEWAFPDLQGTAFVTIPDWKALVGGSVVYVGKAPASVVARIQVSIGCSGGAPFNVGVGLGVRPPSQTKFAPREAFRLVASAPIGDAYNAVSLTALADVTQGAEFKIGFVNLNGAPSAALRIGAASMSLMRQA